ncbi:MAG TPA: hypothetical protein VI322_04240, partial [Candidatus Saccharimonadia bacterium]
MRQSRKQRLLKKRARIQRVALLSYVLILATAGTAWIVMARAAANCTDAAPCAEAGSPVAAANWSLRFADEFNGNAVDLANWNTGRNAPTTTADEPFNGSHEAAYFTSDNVSVGGGLATIQLQAARRTISGVTYRYSSGELNTLGKLALKPGDYIEARIKVPKCNGCWPAFWTVPSIRSPPPEF